MKFLQLVIVGLVMSANVYWELTPNGYLAALLGVAAAFLVTISIIKCRDLLTKVRGIRAYRNAQRRL